MHSACSLEQCIYSSIIFWLIISNHCSWKDICITFQILVISISSDKIDKHLMPFECGCIGNSCGSLSYFELFCCKQKWFWEVALGVFPAKGTISESLKHELLGTFQCYISTALWLPCQHPDSSHSCIHPCEAHLLNPD